MPIELRRAVRNDLRMSASQVITEEVTSWPGVEAGPGRRGEFAFRVGRRGALPFALETFRLLNQLLETVLELPRKLVQSLCAGSMSEQFRPR